MAERNMTKMESVWVAERKKKGEREWHITSFSQSREGAQAAIDPIFCDQFHFYRIAEFRRV